MEGDVPEETVVLRSDLRAVLDALPLFNGLDAEILTRHRAGSGVAVASRRQHAVRGRRILGFHVRRAERMPRRVRRASHGSPPLPRAASSRAIPPARWG